MLQRFNMEDANYVAIPADPHEELSSHAHTTAPYREAIGSLMYLSVTTRHHVRRQPSKSILRETDEFIGKQ